MSARGDRGFVLIVVLWVLAVLTVLALSLQRTALLDRRAAAVSLDQSQARALARGAAERGLVELMNKPVHDFLEGIDANRQRRLWWHYREDLTGEEGIVASMAGELFEEDVVYFEFSDAERRISLNDADRELLAGIEDLNHRLVDAIIRRREELEDEDARAFLSVDEVRQLRDIDDEDWFGDGEKPGIRSLLTVWGDGLINVNTASEDVLMSIPDITESVVEAIIAYRNGDDGKTDTPDDRYFDSLQEIASKADVSPGRLEPINRFCKVDSQFYTITGFASQRRGRVNASVRVTVNLEEAESGDAEGEEEMTVLEWREGPFGLTG